MVKWHLTDLANVEALSERRCGWHCMPSSGSEHACTIPPKGAEARLLEQTWKIEVHADRVSDGKRCLLRLISPFVALGARTMSQSYKSIEYSWVVYLCVGCTIDAALAAVGRLPLMQSHGEILGE